MVSEGSFCVFGVGLLAPQSVAQTWLCREAWGEVVEPRWSVAAACGGPWSLGVAGVLFEAAVLIWRETWYWWLASHTQVLALSWWPLSCRCPWPRCLPPFHWLQRLSLSHMEGSQPCLLPCVEAGLLAWHWHSREPPLTGRCHVASLRVQKCRLAALQNQGAGRAPPPEKGCPMTLTLGVLSLMPQQPRCPSEALHPDRVFKC